MEKDLNYYMGLPYTKYVERFDDDDVYFVAFVKELKGCTATGDTPEEAFEELELALHAYLETKIKYNDHIPDIFYMS